MLLSHTFLYHAVNVAIWAIVFITILRPLNKRRLRAEYKDGFKNGECVGYSNAVAVLMPHVRKMFQAKRDGYEQGYDQGRRAGYEQGYKAGYAEAFFTDDDEDDATEIVNNGDQSDAIVLAPRTPTQGDAKALVDWQVREMTHVAIAAALLMGGNVVNLDIIQHEAANLRARYMGADQLFRPGGFNYQTAAALVTGDTYQWCAETFRLAKAA
jgi:hypothetical protein